MLSGSLPSYTHTNILILKLCQYIRSNWMRQMKILLIFRKHILVAFCCFVVFISGENASKPQSKKIFGWNVWHRNQRIENKQAAGIQYITKRVRLSCSRALRSLSCLMRIRLMIRFTKYFVFDYVQEVLTHTVCVSRCHKQNHCSNSHKYRKRDNSKGKRR